ncbi:MAG: ATP-binding protein [Bacteroidetes bacterium]|nr:ATP-binding protein [Bacteroidota bacterium]
MIRKIAITGPESTGKSMLAEQLAGHYDTTWVPEYAREYLELLGAPYQEKDILLIARGQLSAEASKLGHASNFLFCDTELLVTKIWSDVKYGRCDPWITEMIDAHPYDLFLLCDIDLPWQFDPLREHPDQRQFLFDLYFNELKNRKLPFAVVHGTGPGRLKNAVEIIENFPF